MFLAPALVEKRGLAQWWTAVAGLYLAGLTVKEAQEIGGVRVVSCALPIFLLFVLMRGKRSITMPGPVLWLLIVECVLLPAVSVVSKRSISIYEIYLVWTAVSAVIFMVFFRNFVSSNLSSVGNIYAYSLIPVCILSFVFTSKVTWFGAYAIASLSDFSTFFALQVSVGVPFVTSRWKNAILLIFAITLWFLFSRLSLVLSTVGVLVQRVRFSSFRSLLTTVATSTGVVVAAFLLAQTSLGSEFVDKLINTSSSLIGNGDNAITNLNPSDLGRLAYIVTTLNAITPTSFFVGHGIRTNHEIIADSFDPAAWNLDDSFQTGAVHNVYLEILSDCGIVALAAFLVLGFWVVNKLRRRGLRDPVFVSAVVFFVSYLLEANYLTFFFQLFLIYFVWIAALTPRTVKK